MRILAGICAAGASSRMGFDKLTTPPSLHSQDTLLHRAITAARDQDILVALPAADAPYARARYDLVGSHVSTVHVEGTGFSDTLKALARGAEGYDGLMVMLADMPFVTAAHVAQLVELFGVFRGDWIVRAASESGRDGHPVIFPAHILGEFASLTGDTGAQALIDHHGVKRLDLPSEAATLDVDTPEDWRGL